MENWSEVPIITPQMDYCMSLTSFLKVDIDSRFGARDVGPGVNGGNIRNGGNPPFVGLVNGQIRFQSG